MGFGIMTTKAKRLAQFVLMCISDMFIGADIGVTDCAKVAEVAVAKGRDVKSTRIKMFKSGNGLKVGIHNCFLNCQSHACC